MTPEEFRAGVAAYPAEDPGPVADALGGAILLTGHVEAISDVDSEPVLEACWITASRRGFERSVRFQDPLGIIPVSYVGKMCRDAIENLTRNEEAFS